MAELRIVIDDLDTRLVGLLALRSDCIDRAVELKHSEGLPARIDARIEEVVANTRRTARDVGLDPDLAERLWREIIGWSVAREERAFAATEGESDGR
jgi:isochorismate pyruvate lyase